MEETQNGTFNIIMRRCIQMKRFSRTYEKYTLEKILNIGKSGFGRFIIGKNTNVIKSSNPNKRIGIEGVPNGTPDKDGKRWYSISNNNIWLSNGASFNTFG